MLTKNRDRLPTTDMSRKVMAAIRDHREVAPLLSDAHVSVDGTLIKAWASMKGFQTKPETAPPDDEDPGDPPSLAAAERPPANPEPDPMPRASGQNRKADVDFGRVQAREGDVMRHAAALAPVRAVHDALHPAQTPRPVPAPRACPGRACRSARTSRCRRGRRG